MRRTSLGFILLVVLLGAMIGGALGEVLALILPQGVVREFFLRAAEVSVGPAALNLILVKLTLGLALKINVISVLGIFLASYFLRWYSR